ncbi:filamentous hemagglutinin N-terminal domain-containing protein, partial [Shewanella sp. A3A]|nr:filamentous hemagglutinin N-terminal domain-containing protein [Shewanella ferrihydritica]
MKKNRKKKSNSTAVATVVSASFVAFSHPAAAAFDGLNPATAGLNVTTTDLTRTIDVSDTAKAIINWNQFNIAAGETLTFNQQAASSIVLNRVIGNGQSAIDGAINANGRVFILNPQGVAFGAGAKVNVAGLLASTFGISDADFNDGKFNFTRSSVDNNAAITNAGELQVGENGFLFLVANNVENTGKIIANVGTVTLTDSGEYQFNLDGNGLITFNFDATANTAYPVTDGTTLTPQNLVLDSAQADTIVSSVVNSGDIQSADAITIKAGTVASTGTIKADTLTLSSTNEGASIGSAGNALKLDANTLSVSTNKGHIVVEDTAGGVAIDTVTTGDNSPTSQLRALITSDGGSITAVAHQPTTDGNGQTVPAAANVTAWATNLVAKGEDAAIGAADQAVTTDVRMLNASTEDGAINIDNIGTDSMVVNKVIAKEIVDVNGTSTSIGAMSNADGDITLSTGELGHHDVTLHSAKDMVLADAVTATRNLTLSAEGSISSSTTAAIVTGRDITLTAKENVGVINTQDSSANAAVNTSSSRLNVTAGSGTINIQETNDLRLETADATGDKVEVNISTLRGNLSVGQITTHVTDSAEKANVSLKSADGVIQGNGSASANVIADTLSLTAETGIGEGSRHFLTQVGELTSSVEDGSTFIDNAGQLTNLNVTTNNGLVSISGNNANLLFDDNSSELTLDAGLVTTQFAFSNTNGNLIANAISLDGGTIALDTSGALTNTAGTSITAANLSLTAGSGINVQSVAGQIDATSTAGNIDISNTGYIDKLQFTATAEDTSAGNVTLTTGGALDIDGVQANGAVSLSANGAVTGTKADGLDVSGRSLAITGVGVGSASDALTTQVSGDFTIDAGGLGFYGSNTGSVTALTITAGSDIDFSTSGSAVINTLSAGGSVNFSAFGAVTTADNVNGDNISGTELTLSAESIGTEAAAITVNVDKLVLDTRNGGIYIANGSTATLDLQHAKATNGDVVISSAGDIDLNEVLAASHAVTINATGHIGRSSESDGANVKAQRLTLAAGNGVGGPNEQLSLDVNQMAVSGGSGSVNAANVGAVSIDKQSLSANGTQGVSIIATSITVLDNSGEELTIAGGSLHLTATNGNIVFLNQDDTIHVVGGGDITLTAKGQTSGAERGYYGSIVTGNLTTDDGDITLTADRNITLGYLNAGDRGDVSVSALDGIILDGNGTAQNLKGDHVTLIANTPTERNAMLHESGSRNDYATNKAFHASTDSELTTAKTQRDNLETQLQLALATLSAAKATERKQERDTNNLANTVSRYEQRLNSLNRTMEAASATMDGLAVASGVAQAIPFSGDGGGEAASAVGAAVLSSATLAVNEFERDVLNPAADNLVAEQDALALAQANTNTAQTLVDKLQQDVNTQRAIVDELTQQEFDSNIAMQASAAVSDQSMTAYDLAKDIQMSAENPLGVEANQLDMGTTNGRNLNTNVYLTSDGSLGLGNIHSPGEIIVKNVAKDITIVGDTHSFGDNEAESIISLQAAGSVYGDGGEWTKDDSGNYQWKPQADTGTLTADKLAIKAGTGVAGTDTGLSGTTDANVDEPYQGAATAAINTKVSTIAVNSDTGDIYINNANANDKNELLLDQVDGVNGLKTDGDLNLTTAGSLRLKTQVVDTNTADDSQNSATLVATAGAIIDDNGSTLNEDGTFNNTASAINVIAHEVNFTAKTDVELDTKADLLTLGQTTDDGDVTLRNQGALYVDKLSADKGSIELTNKGDLTLDTLSATGTAEDNDSNITLTAIGDIKDDLDNTSRISSRNLTLKASGSIGASGQLDSLTTSLDTTVENLTASAQGAIYIQEADDLNVLDVSTSQGNITLDSETGSLNIDKISTEGTDTDNSTTTLRAKKGIYARSAVDDTAEVHSQSLAMYASEGIGKNEQSLLIEAKNLEAQTTAGGVYINDRNNNVTVGGVTPNLGMAAITGVTAGGDIKLNVADGSLNVIEQINQTGTDNSVDISSKLAQNYTANVTTDGNTKLSSKDAEILINQVAIKTKGSLTADAGTDITLLSAQTTSGDNSTLTAGNNISLAKDEGNDTASSITADKALSATATTGDITLVQDSTLEAKGGDITAKAGNDISYTDSKALASANITETAANNITLTRSNNEAGAALSATATAGDITLTTSSMTAKGGDITAKAGKDISTTNSSESASASITETAAQNVSHSNSTLTAGAALSSEATAGALKVTNSGLFANGGDMSLTAGTDISLSDSTNTASANISETADANISHSNSGTTAGNGITATATEGDITLTSSTLTANGGDITATAGDDILLTDSGATASDNVTETAANNITLTRSNTDAGKAYSATATKGAQSYTDSDINAHDGAMTLNAGTDISLANSGATATKDVDATAGDNISLSDSNMAAGAALSATATNGNITLARSGMHANGGDLTATAGDNISLTDSNTTASANVSETAANNITLTRSHTEAGEALSATATAGNITLTTSSIEAKGGDMDLTAGTDIDATDSRADASANVNAKAIAGHMALTRSEVHAGAALTADAGTDITLLSAQTTSGDNSTLTA